MADPNSDLTQAVADLKSAMNDAITEMDSNFAALQAAVAANNPAAVNAAVVELQSDIQALKDVTARDAPPVAPTP